MATWPSTLPAPSINGYGVDPIDQTVRTNMEVGSRARRRSFAKFDIVPIQWDMSDAQMAIFRAWFDDPAEADGGAGWFFASFLLGNGGFETVEAKFSGPYKAVYVPHMHWAVTGQLEVRYA